MTYQESGPPPGAPPPPHPRLPPLPLPSELEAACKENISANESHPDPALIWRQATMLSSIAALPPTWCPFLKFSMMCLQETLNTYWIFPQFLHAPILALARTMPIAGPSLYVNFTILTSSFYLGLYYLTITPFYGYYLSVTISTILLSVLPIYNYL